jgi:hypothetical protein
LAVIELGREYSVPFQPFVGKLSIKEAFDSCLRLNYTVDR